MDLLVQGERFALNKPFFQLQIGVFHRVRQFCLKRQVGKLLWSVFISDFLVLFFIRPAILYPIRKSNYQSCPCLLFTEFAIDLPPKDTRNNMKEQSRFPSTSRIFKPAFPFSFHLASQFLSLIPRMLHRTTPTQLLNTSPISLKNPLQDHIPLHRVIILLITRLL